MLQAQIFLDANDRQSGQLARDFILQFLLQHHVKGATVFRGHYGFGAKRQLMKPNELFSFDETPLMITFMDEKEIVESTLIKLRKEWEKGLIVTHEVKVWGND